MKTIKANKPEPEDATHDKVEDHGDLSRKNPFDNMSLSDEESTDAKKELDDIGIKFDEARLAKSVTGRGEFTFHIWILGLSEVCAVS